MDNNVDNVNASSTTTAATITITATKTSSSSSTTTTAAVEAQNKHNQPLVATTTNSFWKNSNRIVPGRPSPKRVNSLGTNETAGIGGAGGMMATFRDYQNSVSDAWDTGDDEFCIISNAEVQQQQQQQQQQHSLYRSPDTTLNKTGKLTTIKD